ncbi:N-succinyldiaminopimelate-aminotransferase / acetylornithine transaminase [Campylobacter iguaniorum]|uniref:N-succinyldiaminopimelate-aminotransferase / acetylornithine transaminase n=1 Tax=Campylobacter iguaniorum TaxID=1244531 RepID=A0A076FA95_9BACT|nr:aspartate aminotransferase family protein [Campylobacter iguaniorum]AII14866.1 N-succinyldiaminopimelate-aminotransferase / acetylornithine transaminase [Campylobacter iguaniorum]
MLMQNYARVNLGFKKGKGAVLWDFDDKDYIDFGSGIGVCSLGHSHKKLAKTISKQAHTLLHTSNIYQIKPQEKLSDKMCELLREPYYVFFANSGAEANECAIKLARKYGNSFKEKKYEIFSLANSFHGRTIATLKLTGQEKFHPNDFAPYPEAFKFFGSIDEIIANLSDKTAAVMVELVQGEGGINPLDKADIQKLAKVLKEKKILFITDEVQCGVYRTGEFVTSQIYGVSPDIITFAKGLGGGVAMGACASKEDIFKFGDHGSTFGGNFLATTAGICVLDELEKLKVDGKLDETISEFEAMLDSLVERFPNLFVKRVGLGLMQGLVLKNPENLGKIFTKAMENRVLILKSGKDTLRFLPPLNITKKEIKKGYKRLLKTLKDKELA